jgi:hypothetical protein
MIENLCIYNPHTLEMVEKMVRSAVFNRKMVNVKGNVEFNIEFAYKVSKV